MTSMQLDFVPCMCVGALYMYQSVSNWSAEKSTIKTIIRFAMAYCKPLATDVLP